MIVSNTLDSVYLFFIYQTHVLNYFSSILFIADGKKTILLTFIATDGF